MNTLPGEFYAYIPNPYVNFVEPVTVDNCREVGGQPKVINWDVQLFDWLELVNPIPIDEEF